MGPLPKRDLKRGQNGAYTVVSAVSGTYFSGPPLKKEPKTLLSVVEGYLVFRSPAQKGTRFTFFH